ncbi:sensor domain-containing protein [Cohaesibacter intestini]|uniref:sensor domain-containing protein n=1 Tax=Cohaesibacter intestini TaxID=2211145 RepID=UPI0018E558E1|nr:EAL domain-containing protein [Cohaesibacter intestini]
MKTLRSIGRDRWTSIGPVAAMISSAGLLVAALFQTDRLIAILLTGTAAGLLLATIVGLVALARHNHTHVMSRFEVMFREQDKARKLVKKLTSHKLCIDSHAIVSMTDAKGRITYVNDKFCEISQYSEAELLGRNHRILNSGYHDDSFFQKMYETVHRGEVWSGTVRNRAKDGSFYWVETTVAPVLNEKGELEELISVRTEITSIKEKKDELAKSNHLLQSIFDNFPGAISVYDKDLKLTLSNAAFHELLSVPADTFPIGTSLEDVLRYNAQNDLCGIKMTSEQIDARIKEHLDQARAHLPYVFTCEGKSEQVLEVKGWPLRDKGLLLTHIDVTERHAMIRNLKAKHEEAQQTAQKLQVAQRIQASTHEQLLNSINSMHNGLAIWDSQGYLQLANRAFREFHAPIADQILPGMAFETFMRLSCEKGLLVFDKKSSNDAPDLDHWIKRLVDEHLTQDHMESNLTLRPGTKVVLQKKRVSNGNIITTMIDVTAQRAREEELKRTRDALEHIAYFDSLTTLPNRAHGQQDLEALLRKGDQNTKFAIVQIDLDKFKRVNDTMGHAAGDHLLKVTGSRLSFLSSKVPAFRPYRWGGDEFVAIVLLDDDFDLEGLCQEMTDLVAVPVPYEDTTLWPTTSLGIATYPDDATDLESLMIYADLALYKTKRMGRDGYQFFSAEMKEKVDSDNRIELGVRSALEMDQFELYFQPQISALDESIVGIEALVRWNHPERGQLPPGLFMQVVESHGLAAALGRTVFDKAMMAAKKWMDEGLSFGRLAINLSPGHIQKATLVDDFCDSLNKYDVNPDLLAVELLESVWLDDSEGNIEEIFHRLSAAGVHVELDDFGTGYASLTHLSSLPIDGIKIDRSLISAIPHGDKQRAILELVMSMTKLMQLRVVCEGVETVQQLEAVSKIANCSIQGYLVSRPLSFDQMTSWMRDQRNIGSLKPREPRVQQISPPPLAVNARAGFDPAI